MICAPSEDSDQTGHPPHLIRESLLAAALSHILEFTDLWRKKKKIYLPTNRPLSRVRGNKDIFKSSRDIAMQHQFSKLKAV